MKFKKLSWKITVIVVATVVGVTGTISGIFQARLSMRLGQYAQEQLRTSISDKIRDYNRPFTESIYIARGLRNFAEANFDLSAYRESPEEYFESEITPIMEQFVINTVMSSHYINGAYFSVAPNISGNQYIGEVFIEIDGAGGYEHGEVADYEDYADPNNPEFEWFWGAFLSGEPRWTLPYVENDNTYISYVEPVIINGVTIGVAGIDVSVNSIKELVSEYRVYETGFALIRHRADFFETNVFIAELSSAEKELLCSKSDSAKHGELYRVTLGGNDYVGISGRLINDYDLLILVPYREYNAENTASLIRFAVLFPAITVVVFFLSMLVGRSISKPVVAISKHLEKISQGDYNDELPLAIRQITNEVGVLACVSHELQLRLAYLTGHVKTISEYNLTETVELAFRGDTAAIALNETLNTLNVMFGSLNEMADQLRSEAANLADGSDVLSGGCLEQTSSVEALTTAMDRIVSNNSDSVQMLGEALQIEKTVREDAQDGDSNMQKLTSTVREINEASNGIHKILKAIEDIAFQTNILALNAAVEAARAGQHGKGFAVVAEEVRNLAAKSALAAKETANLVGVSTQKAQEGEKLAKITADSLEKIIEGIARTEEIIKKIERNSHKNDSDISRMSVDLNNVAGITHKTASTAEETAAMAEEMRGQADSLKDIVGVFKIRDCRR
jgi:methyl-accepting chemotaxis protein